MYRYGRVVIRIEKFRTCSFKLIHKKIIIIKIHAIQMAGKPDICKSR